MKIKKNPNFIIREPFLSDKYRGKYTICLAYDIKKFLGKDHIVNWKEYQFSELQALLSLYSLRNEELKFFLEKDQKVFNQIEFNKYENLEQIPGRKPEYDPYYLLIFIRNKFTHNQLPAEPIYETALTFLPNNSNTLAEYYHKLFTLLKNNN